MKQLPPIMRESFGAQHNWDHKRQARPRFAWHDARAEWRNFAHSKFLCRFDARGRGWLYLGSHNIGGAAWGLVRYPDGVHTEADEENLRSCDACRQPALGQRWICPHCPNFDLCRLCYERFPLERVCMLCGKAELEVMGREGQQATQRALCLTNYEVGVFLPSVALADVHLPLDPARVEPFAVHERSAVAALHEPAPITQALTSWFRPLGETCSSST